MAEQFSGTGILEITPDETLQPASEAAVPVPESMAEAAHLAHPEAVEPLGRLSMLPGLEKAVRAPGTTTGFSSS